MRVVVGSYLIRSEDVAEVLLLAFYILHLSLILHVVFKLELEDIVVETFGHLVFILEDNQSKEDLLRDAAAKGGGGLIMW